MGSLGKVDSGSHHASVVRHAARLLAPQVKGDRTSVETSCSTTFWGGVEFCPVPNYSQLFAVNHLLQSFTAYDLAMLRFLRNAALGLTLISGVSQLNLAAAQVLQLPTDYFTRFSSTSLVASSVMGFGLQSFPLPLPLDIRVSLVKAPTYNTYGLDMNAKDTTVKAGVFYNNPRFELSYHPDVGGQYVAAFERNAAYFYGGYASRLLDSKVRVVNDIGVVFVNEEGIPFTYHELGAYIRKPMGSFVSALGGTSRIYVYPTEQQYQWSNDVSVSGSYRVSENFSIEGSHLARFVQGKAPAFNLGDIQNTNLGALYRFTDTGGPLSLGALQARYSRNWLNGNNFIVGDILLGSSYLPVLAGPSIGYEWTDNGQAKRWVFGLASVIK